MKRKEGVVEKKERKEQEPPVSNGKKDKEEREKERLEVFTAKQDEEVYFEVSMRLKGPEGSYSSAEVAAGCRRTIKAGQDARDVYLRAEQMAAAAMPEAYNAMLREYRKAHGG